MLSLQGGVLYLIFYGMTISVQDLGLKNINQNGIFFGITQTLGFLIVLPFIHKQPRKLWSILYQVIVLIGAIGLGFLSQLDQTDFIRLMQTIVSTFIIAVVNSANFSLFFMYVTELFPTRMRGLANAVVLFASKMIGAFAPMLCTLSKKAGYHVLCGCSLLVLLSIPCSFFIKETLVFEKKEG